MFLSILALISPEEYFKQGGCTVCLCSSPLSPPLKMGEWGRDRDREAAEIERVRMCVCVYVCVWESHALDALLLFEACRIENWQGREEEIKDKSISKILSLYETTAVLLFVWLNSWFFITILASQEFGDAAVAILSSFSPLQLSEGAVHPQLLAARLSLPGVAPSLVELDLLEIQVWLIGQM